MTYFRSNTITFEAALRDLHSQSPATREAAATALGEIREEPNRERAVEALRSALDDLRPEVRAAATLSLGEIGVDSGIESVALCLDDGVPMVRQSAAIALGKAASAVGFEPLAEALRSGPPDLRFQAATSLVEIDAERAYDHVHTALLDDDDPEVLGAIALALGTIGDKRAADGIVPLLDHARPQTRFDAAYALAQFGDERAVPALVPFLEDKKFGWDAIEALETSGSTRAIAPLLGVLRRVLGPREQKLRAAGAMLDLDSNHEQSPLARDVLVAGLGTRKVAQRGLAIQLLESVGGAWALPPLRELRSRRAGKQLEPEIDSAIAAIDTREKES
jgi:HEAT repeat protein